MNKILRFVPLLAAGALASGCNDFDYGVTADAFKQKEYAENFEKVFGTPDPNQDWSMAAVISANVNVANAEGATLYILTAAPSSPDCRILAQRVIDGSEITFNAIKGSSTVYVLLTGSNGKSLYSGECAIVNDMVMIGSNTATRAGSISIGGTENISFGDFRKYGIWVAANHSGKTEEEWMAEQAAGGWLPAEYTGDAEPHTKVKTGEYEYKVCSEYNGKKYLIDTYHFDFNYKVNLNYLDGKSVVAAEPWMIKDNAGLFGPDMFFQEQLEYYSDKKAELYGETHDEKLAMLNTIEKGFTVTSTGEGNGEIHVPFIYGGTDNNNMLGYFYYPADQPMGDFTQYPHYILIDDANPGRNLKWTSTGASTGGKGLSDLMATTAMESLLEDERQVTGTDHTLVFFGADYKQTGTTHFPEGYNIVFFLAPGIRNASYNGGQQTHNFAYALPELNATIGKMYGHAARNGGNVSTNGCTEGYDTDIKTDNGGAVKAVAWKYNGKVYMGFEDGGQDEDLNDLMFLIEGKFSTDDILTFYDIKWHLNTNPAIHTDGDLHSSEIGKQEGEAYAQPENPTDPTGQGREFLGWSLDPNATSGTMTIPEASRVTPDHDVCYFAIWEPSGDPTPTPVASWVIACEDLGGDFDYDFNDLVFAIRLSPIAGTNTANLELIPLAAGGTLEAHVMYDNTTDVGEIHTMLGGGTNYTSIINASAGSSVSGGTPAILAQGIDANTDINTELTKISIVVKQKDGNASTNTYISANGHPGSATPQMMLLPGGWCWPSESNRITNVYENFTTWVQNSKTADWTIKSGSKYVTNLLP